MFGVAIVHGLKAAWNTGLPHLHPVWGEVCRGQTQEGYSERMGTLDGSILAYPPGRWKIPSRMPDLQVLVVIQ